MLEVLRASLEDSKAITQCTRDAYSNDEQYKRVKVDDYGGTLCIYYEKFV